MDKNLNSILTDKPRTEVIEHLPFSTYRDIAAVNSSALRALNDDAGGCPARARDELERVEEGESTEDQKFGTLYHSFLLEPELFQNNVCVLDSVMKSRLVQVAKDAGKKPKGFSKNLTEYRQWKAGVEADGKEVMDETRYSMFKLMRNQCVLDPEVWAGLKLDDTENTRTELTMLWGWPVGSSGDFVQCKARADIITPDNSLVDVKTARESSPALFPRSITRWHYANQMAFYRQAVRTTLDLDPPTCSFFAQEKTWPYLPALHDMPAEWLDLSHKENAAAVHAIADHIRRDDWPGFGRSVVLPPAYVEERIALEVA